jgi:hypothetical protein
MRVSKNKVALLSAAVAALFASAAQAQVNLDAVGGAVPAARYAQEIRGPLAIVQAAGNDVKSKIGVGIATMGTLRFARFDLTNATFTAASTQSFTIVGATANIIAGGAGSSFVIFQLSTTGAITQTDIFTFSGGAAAGAAYTIANFDAPVTIRYRLYEFAQNAINTPDTAAQILYSNSGTLFNAAPALRLNNNAAAITSATASSAQSYLRFTTGLTRASLGNVGVVVDTSNTASAGGPILNAAGAAVDATSVATILDQTSTGSTVSVAGDFTATGATAAGVRLSAVNTGCPADPTSINGAASVTSTSAVFNGTGATGLASPFDSGVVQATPGGNDANGRFLCFYATGSAAIPTSDYVATLNPVANAAYRPIAYASRTVGRILRDGSSLMSPWFSTSTGYISRFFLSNTSAVAFPCTVQLIGETGNTLTAGTVTTVTVPANGMVQVAASDILASASVSPRAAAIFNCNAPRGNVNGAYVITNPATGAVSSKVLVAPGTN